MRDGLMDGKMDPVTKVPVAHIIVCTKSTRLYHILCYVYLDGKFALGLERHYVNYFILISYM